MQLATLAARCNPSSLNVDFGLPFLFFYSLLERANTTRNDSLNIEEDRRTIIYNNNMRKHLYHVHVFSHILTAFAGPTRPRMKVLMPNDAP